jgi:hypothetical protein
MQMKTRFVPIAMCLAALALLLYSPVASAIGFGRGPDLWERLELKPVVGRWAEYQMTSKDGKPLTMRASIVGQEDEYFWFETVMTGEDGDKMITKMLVSGDPNSEDNLKRMIVKGGDQPAMEMPVQMTTGMEPPQAEQEMPETKSEDLGMESVTVPAGTFQAHHWRFTTGDMVSDVWIDPEIGPYGLVKSTAKDVTMELLANGDGATSLITETPQKMPMQGFPMPGMGGK